MKQFLKIGFLAIGLLTVTAQNAASADEQVKEKKLDKNVYSIFDLHVGDDLTVGQTFTAKKKDPVLTLPVHAKRMVNVSSPTSYKGLGGGLGIMGPKKTFHITPDMKFFEVFSDIHANIFCEVGRYEHFDNCLIDADGDGMFESGANKHAKEGFAPGKLFHAAPLDTPVAYAETDTLMPVNFLMFYGGGKSRPKLAAILRDLDDKYIPAFLSPEPTKPEKESTLPYVLSFDSLKLNILSRENKVMAIEVSEIADPIVSIKVQY